MKKRILSMVLVLCMLLGSLVFPTTAASAGATEAPASTVSTSTLKAASLTKAEATALTKTLYTTSGTVEGPIDAHNGCWLMKASNTTYKEMTAYVEKLEKKGFKTVVSETTVLDTKFSTVETLPKGISAPTIECPKSAIYANDDYVINTFRITQGDDVAYITIEPIVNASGNYLDVFTKPDSPTYVCDPLLIQIGVDDNTDPEQKDTERSGMSYALRTADGRFIIYDGGFRDDAGSALQNADKLYNVLKKNAPTAGDYAGRVVIAAWVITHPHSDHIGAFRTFTRNYIGYEGAPVTLQSVIADFPSCGTDLIYKNEAKVSKADIAIYDRYLTALQHMGVDVYKAHTGQTYYFNEVELSILYTPQVMYPDTITDGGNTLSIVSRVQWVGKSYNYAAVFTGDATYNVIKKVNSLYSSYVLINNKADTKIHPIDFVQIAHHGNMDSYEKTEAAMEVLATFLETNLAAARYLIPTGVRHGEVVQAKVTAENDDEKKLLGSQWPNNPITDDCKGTVYVAGSSVQVFTMTRSGERAISLLETAGATYYATSPTLAETTVARKNSNSEYYLYNPVTLMTMERGKDYVLREDMTIPYIPNVTQFPICGEIYHETLNGNGHKLVLVSNGDIEYTFTNSPTGILFNTLGMLVYKDSEGKNISIADSYSGDGSDIYSVTQKTCGIKNLTVELPNINLSGSVSGQFGLLVGYTEGAVTNVDNLHIKTGTVTNKTTNPINIGGFVGKLRHGITMKNSSFTGSILDAGTGDSRVGGFIGMVQFCENNIADLSKKPALDDNLTWKITLTNCSVNAGNESGKIEADRFAGGLIGLISTPTNALSNPVSLTVTGCTADGAVEAISTATTTTNIGKAGGLLGSTLGQTLALTVSDFTNNADISAYNAGGAVGYVESASTLSVTNSSNAGTITSTNGSSSAKAGSAGGMVGAVASASTVTVDGFTNSGSIEVATAGTGSVSAVIGTVGTTGSSVSAKINVSNVTNTGAVTD
ncbi:MAG: hypothetical protein IKA05_03410, partial [Clostridia bacterium]|nr:hypothetical protein [Clostridia bacterium]